MRHVWVPDAGNVLLVGVLNLKMYALWGTTDKSQWIHKLFYMYASMGGSAPQSNWFFSWETYWNPWGNRKPGNTWGHRKYSALKTPLAYAFGFFWKQTHANKYKHMQTRSSTHRSHSEDMTLFSWDLDGPRQDLFGLDRYWNVCFAGGTNDYLSQIYSLHFPKMMCFSATQQP